MSTIVLTKSKRCASCKKKPGLLNTCSYCKSLYCFNCIQIEIHNCEKQNDMKIHKLTQLKDKLELEKCIKDKIAVI